MKQKFKFVQTRTLSKCIAAFAFTIIVCGVMAFKPSHLLHHSDQKPFVVMIDAGHGGKDTGHNNEKAINLAISKKLAAMSNDKVKIVLTRDSDKFMSLEERVDKSKTVKPDLFLSLHCNSASVNNYQGAEIYSSSLNPKSELSKRYSEQIMNGISQVTHTENAKIKGANFIVLKMVDCPSALLEMGFLSNTDDSKRLHDDAYQQQFAATLFNTLTSLQ